MSMLIASAAAQSRPRYCPTMLRDPPYVKSAKKLITPTISTNLRDGDNRDIRRLMDGTRDGASPTAP